MFLFSGPICLILAFFSLIYIKNEYYKSESPLDWIGFILAAALLIDTFYMLSVIGKEGLSSTVLGCLILLLGLLIAFIKWESRTQFPLIDLNFFKDEVFVKANLLQLCFQICHFGAIFLIGMYLQVAVGMSATFAGLIMGMQAIGAMVTSRYSVRLYNLYGARLPLIAGLIGVAILSPCIMLIKNPDVIWFGLLLFFIRGFFSGLCGVPIQTLSVIDFSKEKIGSVNSIFNACRQISISLGVAISSILISLGLRINHLAGMTGVDHNQLYKVFIPGFFALPLIAAIAIAIASSLNHKNSTVDNITKNVDKEIKC